MWRLRWATVRWLPASIWAATLDVKVAEGKKLEVRQLRLAPEAAVDAKRELQARCGQIAASVELEGAKAALASGQVASA